MRMTSRPPVAVRPPSRDYTPARKQKHSRIQSGVPACGAARIFATEMPSLSTSLLIAGVMVSVAVSAASVQTEVVSRTTLRPVAGYTIKTAIYPNIGSRISETDPTPLYKLKPCAQAILGCCHPEVKNRQDCFDQIGCGPHFFGDPCDKSYMSQALGGAERFYNQFPIQTTKV